MSLFKIGTVYLRSKYARRDVGEGAGVKLFSWRIFNLRLMGCKLHTYIADGPIQHGMIKY